jgi:hypothetical protein
VELNIVSIIEKIKKDRELIVITETYDVGRVVLSKLFPGDSVIDDPIPNDSGCGPLAPHADQAPKAQSLPRAVPSSATPS